MMNLSVFEYSNKDKIIEVVDSRQVAEIINKNHKDLMRSIREYINVMSKSIERNFAPNEFFIESSYKDSIGRTLPCYLLTKKGCEMVANKMTGEKGILFTAAYVTAFNQMEKRVQSQIIKPYEPSEYEKKQLAMREAEFFERMANKYSDEPTYSQVLSAYATKALTGNFILPLPEIQERTYSASEIGNMLGISANKVGRIAKEHNLKTEKYGKWFHDKSRYSSKEVASFKYYVAVVDVIKAILPTEKDD